MIVVTNKSSPPPLVGRMKGVTWCGQVSAKSPAAALLDALKLFPGERDCFLYVAPTGRVWTAPVFEKLRAKDFDVAACVDRIGSTPATPRQFDGIGIISLETILVRPTPGARRLLERWADRNAAGPSREEVNLCVALAETKDVTFSFLPDSWRWRRESSTPESEAVVRFPGADDPASLEAAPAKPKKVNPPKRTVSIPRGPECLFSAHIKDFSGYATAARNILFRVGNSVRVRLDQSELEREHIHVDLDVSRRIDAFLGTPISERAPLFRFYTPKVEGWNGFRICSTMLETETISKEFADLLNDNYQLCVLPTHWNKGVFSEYGVRIPIEVIPLGTDPLVYRPGPKTPRFQATLLTTSRAGAVEAPRGYTFFTLGQPTFRKNFDTLVAAFDRAFRGSKDVSLVLVTSVHAKLEQYGCLPFSRIPKGAKGARSLIYHQTGTFNDAWQMARLYRSFDCAVFPSIGEGYDLPSVDCASSGLPVILSNCSAHTEIFKGSGAWMFDPTGIEVVPGSEDVCPFYKDQKFATFGERSIEQLSELLKSAVEKLKRSTRQRIVTVDHTWDKTATAVCEKIIEINKL